MAAPDPAPVAGDDSSIETAPVRPPRPSSRPLRGLVQLAGALFTPDRSLPGPVTEGRYGLPFLTVLLAAILAAVAIGLRIDVTDRVLPPAAATATAGGDGGGDGAPSLPSDRELAEKTAKARSVARVMLGLRTGIGLPVELLALALIAWGLGRYVGGTPTMRRSMAAVTHAALPGAVKSVLTAMAALRHAAVKPAEVPALVPPGALVGGHAGVAGRLLAGVDPFLLWSVVLLGFGLAAAARISRRKAFITVIVVFLLYLAITRGILGGAAPPGASR